MRSKAHLAHRSLHPLLVTMPAGGFAMVVIFDLVYLSTKAPIMWSITTPILITALLAAPVAAAAGVVDYVSVAMKQGAGKIGAAHIVLNVIMVLLFAASLQVRLHMDGPPTATGWWFWPSLAALVVLLFSGFLGRTMVQDYHVGIVEHPEAKDPYPNPPRQDSTLDLDVPPGEPLSNA